MDLYLLLIFSPHSFPFFLCLAFSLNVSDLLACLCGACHIKYSGILQCIFLSLHCTPVHHGTPGSISASYFRGHSLVLHIKPFFLPVDSRACIAVV